jgi:hypothetical protein
MVIFIGTLHTHTWPGQEPQNRANASEIHTTGRFVGGGESRRARKAYAYQIENSHEVYAIGRPVKQPRKDSMVIGFSDNYYLDISLPHTIIPQLFKSF